MTAIENVRFIIYLRFIWIQRYRIFYLSRRLFAEHHTISSWCRSFSSRSRSRKMRILSISKFLFIVVIVISILLKTESWQTSIDSQSVEKSFFFFFEDKITFKTLEKHRYGLRKPVSKHHNKRHWTVYTTALMI